LPREQRRDFYVYVDEFQSIATQNFVSLLSEGRKFGIGLVLANQFVSQLENQRILDAVFGNVGTLICFRVGARDAELMEGQLQPTFNRADVLNLPNWRAYVRTLIRGESVQPFDIRTTLADSQDDVARAEDVIKLSRQKFALPRAAVEAYISGSLETERMT
jgi:DNA helicase HerA-like ATPase